MSSSQSPLFSASETQPQDAQTIASRSRPCDTCRLRKTRCVREAGRNKCVLCTFHNQPCTFLRGPLRRLRDRGGREAAPGQPRPKRQDIAGSSPESIGDVPEPGQIRSNKAPSQNPTEPLTPAILDGTLGLDLDTHAEYVGSTDYRDPVLLDLHQQDLLPQSTDSSFRPSRFARRLDHTTMFMVHPDESSTSEAQRIEDLDAIEAAVHPLGRTLVDLYFRIVHPSYPILHKDVFISKHRLSYRHFAPPLLAAVYLIALDWHIYDSTLAGRESESIPNSAALEELAERTMAQDMRRPKLSTLEAGLLLLQRSNSLSEHQLNKKLTSSRTFAAQLVAMAQDIGIHVDCSSWSIPNWEVGLRRRLAWALYVQDRWGSFVFGRPFLIHDTDWDVQPCIDSDYPELSASEYPDFEGAATTQAGWSLFLQHVELAKILSDIMRTFYTTAATRKGGTFDQIGVVAAVELAKPFVLRLREWLANLPDSLRLQSTLPRKICANGALHLAHSAIDIALHRSLMRIITPDTPKPLYTAVRSTARAKLSAAIELIDSLRPEHTAAFWGSAAAYQVAHIGSLAGLLWATAEDADELAWCVAKIDELRWALRVRSTAAGFAREALRLLESDIGGLRMIAAANKGVSPTE